MKLSKSFKGQIGFVAAHVKELAAMYLDALDLQLAICEVAPTKRHAEVFSLYLRLYGKANPTTGRRYPEFPYAASRILFVARNIHLYTRARSLRDPRLNTLQLRYNYKVYKDLWT